MASHKSTKVPWLIQLYLGLSKINAPLFWWIIKKRKTQGKEHSTRYKERFGQYCIQRPKGRLIWFNAASVGEALALRQLIETIVNDTATTHVLITTVTVKSAEVLEKCFPTRAIHQFSPVDTLQATSAFLDHWKPDLAIWCESELWPRLIDQTHKKNIPMALINARISEKTKKRWLKIPTALEWALSHFDKIFAETNDMKALLTHLGVTPHKVVVAGSTKENRCALPFDEAAYKTLQIQTAGRPIWVAASTHPGEEPSILDAHLSLIENNLSNALLILAPRHPDRAHEITKIVQARGLSSAKRSENQPITENIQVYLADTIGEMGLWYELSQIVFVGGSLVEIGGHNPYEPIAMGGVVLTGPFVSNFYEVYDRLYKNNACFFVEDSKSIAEYVIKLMDPMLHNECAKRAIMTVRAKNSTADLILEYIKFNCGA